MVPGGSLTFEPSGPIAPGQQAKATYDYIVKATDGDTLSNVITVDDKTAQATVERNKFTLADGKYSKTADTSITTAGSNVSYTFKYFNDSKYSGTVNDLVFAENADQFPNQLVKDSAVVTVGGQEITAAGVNIGGGKYTLDTT